VRVNSTRSRRQPTRQGETAGVLGPLQGPRGATPLAGAFRAQHEESGVYDVPGEARGALRFLNFHVLLSNHKSLNILTSPGAPGTRLTFFKRVKKVSKETRPTSLPAIERRVPSAATAPAGPSPFAALNSSACFGVNRICSGGVTREEGKAFDCSMAFAGPRAQSPSAGILILSFGEHASRLD